LARLGWSETDLASRRKSDPAKLALAARLRQETTLTIKALAARVHLGTSKSANARLHNWMGRPRRPHQTKLDSLYENQQTQEHRTRLWVDPFSVTAHRRGASEFQRQLPYAHDSLHIRCCNLCSADIVWQAERTRHCACQFFCDCSGRASGIIQSRGRQGH